MDLKAIIKWSLKHWWWFVVSVGICVIIGGVYYVCSTPKYNVKATLMLRQAATGKTSQDEMMKMMGFGESKVASDEIQILTSRDLMGRVIDALNLTTAYYRKSGGKWKEIYPANDIQVALSGEREKTISMDIKACRGGYVIKLKTGMFSSEKISVPTLTQPIHTSVGDLTVTLLSAKEKVHYRVTVTPRILMISKLLKEISVLRASRESNIIEVSCLTECPERSVATINTLLQFYNQESATDKNILAVQTEQFLASRIAVVERELNEVEIALEAYKRTQQIADLEKTAETYQLLSDSYDRQISELDEDVAVLDFISEQISKPDSATSMIAGNLGEEYENLNKLIQDYNENVVHLNELLQAATEQSMVVVREKLILERKRSGIHDGVTQARQAIDLRRQLQVKQRNQYLSRMAAIPETQRVYLEMTREKQTKENQYLYLIGKREENAMLLASEAVPSKIVDQAQKNPRPAQPKLSMVGFASLLIGLMLPLLVYFFGLFRKEYL